MHTFIGIADLSASVERAVLIGLGFIGTIGGADGQFRSAFEVPVEPATASALAQSFISLVVAKLTPSPCADGVDWLRKLYDLPDDRKAMN